MDKRTKRRIESLRRRVQELDRQLAAVKHDKPSERVLELERERSDAKTRLLQLVGA